MYHGLCFKIVTEKVAEISDHPFNFGKYDQFSILKISVVLQLSTGFARLWIVQTQINLAANAQQMSRKPK